MAKDILITDELVEQEIKRLNASEEVALARKEQRIKNKRRQYLYQLRIFEKRGKQLIANGITLENIEEKLFSSGEEEEQDESTKNDLLGR